MLALFLALFAAFWLSLQGLRRLDRTGDARAACRWALSSRSLNACLLLLSPLPILLVLLLSPQRTEADGAQTVWSIALFLLMLPMPFFVLNPATLQRSRLQRWWLPMWPGGWTILVCVMLSALLPALIGFALAPLGDVLSGFSSAVIEWLASVIECIAGILSMAIWLSRGRSDAVRAGLARLFTWSFLRTYSGYILICGMFFIIVAAPVLVCAMYLIFLDPQYEEWLQASGLQNPWGMEAIVRMGGIRGSWGMLAIAVPFGALSLFSNGRLLIQAGVCGTMGPATSPVDGSSC